MTLIEKDLKEARADMKIIVNGVKGVGADAGTDTQPAVQNSTSQSGTNIPETGQTN